MPSIYTHNYFAKDTYNKIDNKIKYRINNKLYYEIFAQSFDNLFYYNSISIFPGKKYQKLGHYAHTHKVWKYFKNLVEYIKENKLYDDENLGYLYGSLTHYALDSTAHPYIHYISGRYSKAYKKETRKYLGNHAKNEIMIDSIYYYKDHNDKYYKFKTAKELIPVIKFPEGLKNTISHTFKETFDVDNIGDIFNKSYNQSHYVYKFLMYDRTSIKKTLYKIVDFFSPTKNFKANCYSHHINKPDYTVMNNEKNTWLHPITGEEHNESFEELYKIAQDKVIKYISKCNDYFDDKCSIKDLEKTIGNISYSSGLDSDLRPKFIYFKN